MGKKKSINISKKKDLTDKMKQCDNFFKVICIGGISIPLIIHTLIYEEQNHILTIIALITAGVPSIFAYFALSNYGKAHKTSDTSIFEKKGIIGDRLLYIGGILSIIFIAIYIGLSGGVRNHFMAYYFIFIPSATAIAFTTRKGLWYVSGMSAMCLIILYWWFYELDKIDEPNDLLLLNYTLPYKVLHLFFILYQIFLIIQIELMSNKLSK